jgi:peptidyl-prolyl cis-trans isomerase B (cyclophilin B)
MQLMPPARGDTVAILHTTLGDITLRFFPDETPLAYENFITHARTGYYDGTIFHRVMNEFMIQGGDPEGTGYGGESIWGAGFGQEYSDRLKHFRGALSMAQSDRPNSIGSQFFIVQNTAIHSSYAEFFNELYNEQDEVVGEGPNGETIYVRDIFPSEALDYYIKNGGTPHLDLALNQNGHTVFGQVIAGMEVVDAIAAVPVDENDKPLTDVVITSVTVTTY